MEEKQEGPRGWQVYGYVSCMGCCYHDQRMIKSGLHPIYWHYCLHPSNPPYSFMMQAYLTGSKGRFIGSEHITPSWCQVLNPKDSKNV